MATIHYGTEDNPRRMHIQVREGEIGEYVILPGDPARCDVIASYFDHPVLVAQNREHKTYTGIYRGVRVSVTSTGMGCPSAAIAAEELCQCGAKVLLRLGGCVPLKPGMKPGDLSITLAAMKNEGTSRFFVPDALPAVADLDLAAALIENARRILKDTGYTAHAGVTASNDAFYGETAEFVERMGGYGIISMEMEASAILTVCHCRGVRGGAICACGSNSDSPEAAKLRTDTTSRQIQAALDAFVTLEQKKQTKSLFLSE